MSTLLRNTDLSGENFIKLLTKEPIIVMEDVQGSKIWASYSAGDWTLRPKSVHQNPINMIDLAMQKYYKLAYTYLYALATEVTDLIRPNYSFGFEFFPDEQPGNIKYDKVPKNNLILTCICKYGKQYIYDTDELKVWADLLGVETLPLIYKGKLGDKQIQAINHYLHTSPGDIDLLWNGVKFSEFFYKTLNPATTNSYLSQNFNDNLEKIIIRFVKSNYEVTLEILNPMYQKMVLKSDAEFSDVYSILLFNFVQFMMGIDLKNIDISGTSRDRVYINLISKLYNMYISKYEKSITDFKFAVPKFFSQDKFRINQDLISNKTTLDYINKSIKLEYIFKIILGSFQRERKKPIGIINEIALEHLNRIVKKINIKVEEQFNYNQKLNIFTYKVKDMSDYPNIKYQRDDKGYVYYDIGSLFDSEETEHDKKKGKKQ